MLYLYENHILQDQEVYEKIKARFNDKEDLAKDLKVIIGKPLN